MAIALTKTRNVLSVDGHHEVSDDQLMVSFGRGDRSAFDQLYSRYKQPLYGYLFRNCGHTVFVEELFQDVWLRVIASAPRYQRKGRFRSWVFTLAHNCMVDYYRRSSRQSVELHVEAGVVDEHFASEQTVAEDFTDSEINTAIQKAIACLPLDQRQAFCLREESGFSVKEIAQIQGITAEAAKSRLRYAYQKLRTSLADQHE